MNAENFLLLLLHFLLRPLAYFPSELIWNYGSYRQLVGLLGQGISPVTRPLPIYRATKIQKKCGEISMSGLGFEPTIPVSKRANHFIFLTALPLRSAENNLKCNKI
jgi:hypothetical protein